MLIENKKGTLVKYKIHTLFSISSQNVCVKSRNPDMTTPQNLFSEYQERKRGVLGLKEEF